MSKRFVQQRLKCRVAADNAIECDHRCGRNLRPDVNEVAVHEVDSSKSVAARRFLSRGGEVGGRCVDGDRALDATLEQLKAQSADSRADIEQDAPDRTGADEEVAKQPSRRPRTLLAIAFQIA